MIKDIALLVREEMESFVQTQKSFSKRDLAGACGVSSWVLDRVLRRLGHKSRFVMGHFNRTGDHTNPLDNHCWVEAGGDIVDVTATQFNIPDRVHVVQAPDSRYQARHSGLAGKRRLSRWPAGQSQMCYRTSLDDITRRVYKRVKAQTQP